MAFDRTVRRRGIGRVEPDGACAGPVCRTGLGPVPLRHAELRFQIGPTCLRPAIRARAPCGRTGVDAYVQRLVALAQLLPFELREAAPRLHRDQLLCRELLEPFPIRPVRQMDRAGRALRRVGIRRTCVAPPGRRFRLTLPQEAVGLGLEG
jgi:hypothetical protein